MISKSYKLNKKIKFFIILILTFVALISVFRAFQQAQVISFDFHLSPAQLVSEGINHYQYILDGKHDDGPNDRLMYDQNGVYAQGLFVLFIPFTWLDWDNAKLLWSIINIFLSFLIPILICKKFELNTFETFLATSLFLISTIFRIHIGYGQQTLFTFVFFILPFIYKSNISIILSGISYFKFNIGYVLFLYFASLKSIKKIILSIIPFVIGWISYCYITNTNLLKNLFEPLQTILYFGETFPVTIFSFLEKINFHPILILLIPIILNFLVLIKIKNTKNQLLLLSIICLSALGFLPHQLHDYILLLPLLIFSIKNFDLLVSKLNLIFIFYFFYFLRIVSFVYGTQPWEFPYGYFGYFNNFLTISFILINLYFLKKIDPKSFDRA